MKELGITKGEWKITKKDDLGVPFGLTHAYCIESEGIVVCDIICDENGLKEAKNDAKLIADAGTTANKCGMLPSELLERYNEAIEALNIICGYGNTGEDAVAMKEIAEQTISKANGK